ncbi:hypothetical protein [Herpetosiphon llansteffanensis]|uniref:hypothetical protein n=1 Tax=Herpetosiphon llansteffanensis TaxID=2094568 RepID=UPI000D7D1FF0|nr:hypothetical protein [Herpetosiphon llansteffanensis]
MSNQYEKDALERALKAKSPLELEEAREQIPALIAAELAGDNVDLSFAMLFKAFDVYPELAEEYFTLMETQIQELENEKPLIKPPTIPQFVAVPIAEHVESPNIVTAIIALLRPLKFAKGATYAIEAPDDIVGIVMEATMPPVSKGSRRELAVELVEGAEAIWRVTASIGGIDLTLIRQEQQRFYFDLDAFPQESPIELRFHPSGPHDQASR